MKPVKICITGGPCAGKSSVIAGLMAATPERFLQIPEVASYCVPMGLRRHVPAERVAFQHLILSLQDAAQSAVYSAAVAMKRHVLADRGSLDVFAYLDRSAVDAMNPQRLEELRDWYDLVIHLRSLAVDYPDRYSDANNVHRDEDAIRARQLDERLQELWGRHESYYLVEAQASGVASKIVEVRQLIERLLPSG